MSRLLLVEDDVANALTLEVLLEDEGWLVTVVDSLRDARAQLAAGTWDVCILDRGLGGDDGLTLVGPLREQSPGVRIILLSGQSASEPLPPGIDAQFEKGSSVDDLISALR